MKLTMNHYAVMLSLVSAGAVAFTAYRSAKAVTDATKPIVDGINSVSATAGVVAADISAGLNGHSAVQIPEARIFLAARYVEDDFTVHREWRKNISNGHPDIPALFDLILDPKGRLRVEYRHLIDNEISLDTVYQNADFSGWGGV